MLKNILHKIARFIDPIHELQTDKIYIARKSKPEEIVHAIAYEKINSGDFITISKL